MALLETTVGHARNSALRWRRAAGIERIANVRGLAEIAFGGLEARRGDVRVTHAVTQVLNADIATSAHGDAQRVRTVRLGVARGLVDFLGT